MKNRIFEIIFGWIFLIIGIVFAIDFLFVINNREELFSEGIAVIFPILIGIGFVSLLIVTAVLLLREKKAAYKSMLLLGSLFFIETLFNFLFYGFHVMNLKAAGSAIMTIVTFCGYFFAVKGKDVDQLISRGFRKFILCFLLIGAIVLFGGYFLIRNSLNVDEAFSYDDKLTWETEQMNESFGNWRSENVVGMKVEVPMTMHVHKRETAENGSEKTVFLETKSDLSDEKITLIFGKNMFCDIHHNSYEDVERLFQDMGLVQLFQKATVLGQYQRINNSNWVGFIGNDDNKTYRVYLWEKNKASNLEIWFIFNKVKDDFNKKEFINKVINSLESKAYKL